MQNPNRRLLQILVVGWLAFFGAGVGLRQARSGPSITIIIDRSYCDPSRWEQITADYAEFYSQHHQKSLTIDQVIYVSDLGQEVAEEIPSPQELMTMSTYGRFNPDQLQQATAAHPNAKVFACSGGNP